MLMNPFKFNESNSSMTSNENEDVGESEVAGNKLFASSCSGDAEARFSPPIKQLQTWYGSMCMPLT